MGKHVKKKIDAPRRSSLPREETPRTRGPYEDWFGAAAREVDFEDIFTDAEQELSPLPEDDPPAAEGFPDPEPEIEAEAELPAEPEILTAAEIAVEPEVLTAAELLLEPETDDEPEPSAEEIPAPEPPMPKKEPECGPRARNVRSPGKSAPPKKKKRKKSRAFRKGLRVYVIIMLVLIALLCAALWIFLTRWQGKKDAEAAAEAARQAEILRQREAEEAVRRAPQLAFESWLEQTGPDDWTDLWFAKTSDELEDREAVRGWMEEHFAAAEPFRAAEYTAETPVYVLREGDDTLARITLAGSGTSWTVSQTELTVEGRESASVSAITGSRVFCNGRELGPEYITETASSFTYEPLADRLVNPIERITYTVEGLLLPPALTAEPPADGVLAQTADGNYLLCLEGEQANAMAQRAVDFVRAYLFYYLKGSNNTYGNLAHALSYLTPGTQAYTDLNDTAIGVVWNPVYNGINTDDTTASQVVIWADNCCSVDVTYDAVYSLNDGSTEHSTGSMRFYFLRSDNGNYYISNFETL